ncbi:G2/M phase-specific E3 ubiquitin-protein ligase-like [Dendronephthya gigantea]|uniref:G2/M phase-specific E3 ubiquitin-protein ligase-like n=1 Tax=Dendronephthya gigantea TaxID=151771 RepID=UPI00106D8B7C|nr:G2/M phase-specific E3 ubiquitin-protein ligase-like [Dendronephthya gigantea]
MCEISESSIFHGSWFSHDLGLLASRCYELAGKLVAWSILHGGSGPRCLSSVGYDLQQSCQVALEKGVDAVNDMEMKSMLQDFINCTSEDIFTSLVSQHGDKIAELGYSKIYSCNLSHKNEMIESLLKQHFVYGVNAEVLQFFYGLNSIGQLGDMILQNRGLFDLILGNQHPVLTKSTFMALYELNRSEEGSNERSKEDTTIYCFKVFLQDLEEGDVHRISLEDLLVFNTGANCFPPLGFSKKIIIDFYNFEENNRRRPFASTCGLYFFLPRGFEDPVEFSEFLREALLQCHGFGKL